MADLNLEGLSPEDQVALQAIMRQKQFAQMLQQRSMQSSPTEYSPGGIAVKQSPLSALLRGAQGYFGQKWQGDADTRQAGVVDKFQNQQQAEIQALMADPKAGVAKALASKIPAVRNAAAALAKEQKERDKFITEMGAKINAPKALEQFLAGKPGSVGGFEQPKVVNLPDGPGGKPVPVLQNAGEGGRPSATPFPVGDITHVDARQAGREGEMTLDTVKADLTNRKTQADAAKSVLSANSFALDALESGAKAGGGEVQKQVLRKVLQAINVPTEGLTETNQLQMALGKALLAETAKIRPASDTDILLLKDIVGNIGTDPQALTKALAFSNALALREMQQFGGYVSEQKKNLKTPYAQDLFSGAGIGYELPKELYGPQPFQMETIRHLKRLGGDLSMFRDFTGEPFPDKFDTNITPTKGMPGIVQPPNTPAVKPRFKPIAEMTEEEKRAELAALRATMGGGKP